MELLKIISFWSERCLVEKGSNIKMEKKDIYVFCNIKILCGILKSEFCFCYDTILLFTLYVQNDLVHFILFPGESILYHSWISYSYAAKIRNLVFC